VEEALLILRGLAGVAMDPGTGGVGALSPPRRHLRGMTDIFLARARRQQDVDDGSADELYADAMEMLNIPGDSWNLAWLEAELSELWRRRGDHEQAMRFCERGLERARQRGTDCEVVGILHHVHAQVAWDQGDLTAAFDAYGRALLNIYALQASPHPPDEYTRTMYELLGSLVVGRLRALVESGRSADAIRGFSMLHKVWHASPGAVVEPDEAPERLLAIGSADLAPFLFPRGPTTEELKGEPRERYARLARLHADAILGPTPPRP
jgi:tetratricopeptide (TPR) repeat protein